MNAACFFCTYFNGHNIPYYVRVYLEELSRHFKKVYVLTNRKDLNDESEEFIEKHELSVHYYENEGYDFGMWAKALREINTDGFDSLALINDSCILFRELDHVFRTIQDNLWDFSGLIASSNIKWHIQSYFMVFNKNAIPHLKNYLAEHGIKSDLKSVIHLYETGLSQYMLQNKMHTGTVFQSSLSNTRFNPSYLDIVSLIRSGFPMIKKKLVFGNYRLEELPGLFRKNFNFNAEYYIRIIESEVKDPIIDFNHLKMDYYTAWHVIRRTVFQFISRILLSPLNFFRKA